MANGQVLSANAYTLPGSYIGQVFTPQPSTLEGEPRLPVYVGRGSRYRTVRDIGIRRSFLFAQQLNFSMVAPHEALLPYPALNDQTGDVRLRKQDGSVVNANDWIFKESVSGSGVFDQVQINTPVFDSQATYNIDYQSTSRDIRDVLPFDELRAMVRVGDFPNQVRYIEGLPDANLDIEGHYIVNTNVAGQASTGADKLRLNQDSVANNDTEQSITGTAAGGGTDANGPYIDLETDTSQLIQLGFVDWPNGKVIKIISGTGTGQVKTITAPAAPPAPVNTPAYDMALNRAYVNSAWVTPPDATSVYVLIGVLKPQINSAVNNAAAGAGTGIDTIQINAADNQPDDFYNNAYIVVEDNAVPGSFQAGQIANYVSATDDVQVTLPGAPPTWTITVGALSNYWIFPNSDVTLNAASGFTHPYTRQVIVEALSGWAGVAPNRAATMEITVSPVEGGNESQVRRVYQVLIDENGGTPQCDVWRIEGGGVERVANDSPLTNIDLEFGLKLDLSLGSVGALATDYELSFQTGDTWTLYAIGSALVEIDGAFNNDNQRPDMTTPAPDLEPAISGTSTAAGASDITLDVIHLVPFTDFYKGRKITITSGPGITEFKTVTAYNATTNVATVDVAWVAPPTASGYTLSEGTGTIAQATSTDNPSDFYDYTGESNRRFLLQVTAVSGTPLAADRTATFQVQSVGEYDPTLHIVNSFVVDEATPATRYQNLGQKVWVDIQFGAQHWSVGDVVAFEALAPFAFYTAKDDRDYINTTGPLTQPTATAAGGYSADYTTNTPEGSFGSWDYPQAVPPATPYFSQIPDGIRLWPRNIGQSQFAGYNRHTVADAHSFTAFSEDTIDWSLTEEVTEEITTGSGGDVLQDVTGSVTGTPGTFYVILNQIPTEVISVTDSVTGAAVSWSQVLDPVGNPTQFISLGSSMPANNVQIRYVWRSPEPDPGQVYYLTATILRPDSLYDEPIRLLSNEDAVDLLSPMEPLNHVLIMSEIGFENGVFGCYVVQIKDRDGDGIYTDYDYKQGIFATEKTSAITDVTVLDRFTVTPDLKTSVIRMNDPFERKDRLAWIGMPIGSEIGDQDTADTLVFTSKRALQVYGNSPAHGAFILIGNTYCKRTILLPDQTTTQVELDGSFVAGASAALQGALALTDIGETILRKDLAGFDFIGGAGAEAAERGFNETEAKVIGTASITSLAGPNFISTEGGTFQFTEDITVDTNGDQYNQINAMVQKQGTIREVRASTDRALISIVPPSVQAGIALIKSFVVEQLATRVSSGKIAPYEDADGNSRPISAQEDVEVFRDPSTRTLYHFRFWFVLRYPIKRLFGLYSADTRFFNPQ